ncbi:MAG: hypothetical protein IPJ97_18620 [Proteobacteria bacterium]|nr:hypothetical protein [Pseudomonadota bacterium]
MTSVLILYMTRGGHTARIARRLCEHIGASGGRAEMMPLVEAAHEGVDWNRYGIVALGAPVLCGKSDQARDRVRDTAPRQLEISPTASSTCPVARVPEKSTVEGNRYTQKFLQLSPWRPRDRE